MTKFSLRLSDLMQPPEHLQNCERIHTWANSERRQLGQELLPVEGM